MSLDKCADAILQRARSAPPRIQCDFVDDDDQPATYPYPLSIDELRWWWLPLVSTTMVPIPIPSLQWAMTMAIPSKASPDDHDICTISTPVRQR